MAGTYVARRERLASRLAVRSVAAEAAQTLPLFFPFAFFCLPLIRWFSILAEEEGESGDIPRPAKGLPPLGTLLKMPFIRWFSILAEEEGESGDVPRPAKGLPPLGILLKIPFAGEEGEGNTPRLPLGTLLRIR